MMCLVQIGLVVAGAMLLKKREIRVGSQVATAPTPFFMGLVLIVQLPLVLMVGFGLGFSEGLKIAEKSKGKQVSQAEMTAQAEKFQKKYWWIDVAFPAGAAAIAGVILALGLKDPQPQQKDPYGEPDLEPEADPYAGAERPRREEYDDEPRPRRNRRSDDF